MMTTIKSKAERFQPYLQNNDYTFIGPVNSDLMQGFISTANMLAPVVAISRSIHHALSHQQSVRRALGTFKYQFKNICSCK